jgi:hypothetical protein
VVKLHWDKIHGGSESTTNFVGTKLKPTEPKPNLPYHDQYIEK